MELYFSTYSDPENKLGDKPDVSSDDSDADTPESETPPQSDGENNIGVNVSDSAGGIASTHDTPRTSVGAPTYVPDNRFMVTLHYPLLQ